MTHIEWDHRIAPGTRVSGSQGKPFVGIARNGRTLTGGLRVVDVACDDGFSRTVREDDVQEIEQFPGDVYVNVSLWFDRPVGLDSRQAELLSSALLTNAVTAIAKDDGTPARLTNLPKNDRVELSGFVVRGWQNLAIWGLSLGAILAISRDARVRLRTFKDMHSACTSEVGSDGTWRKGWEAAPAPARVVLAHKGRRLNLVNGEVWRSFKAARYRAADVHRAFPLAPALPSSTAPGTQTAEAVRIPVWVMESRDGRNVAFEVWADEESAVADLAASSRRLWSNIAGMDGVPARPPLDDQEAIDIYYAHRRRAGETYRLRQEMPKVYGGVCAICDGDGGDDSLTPARELDGEPALCRECHESEETEWAKGGFQCEDSCCAAVDHDGPCR